MRLPRALAHWAPYLDLFPHDVALALAPLAARVALAVGPLAGRTPLEGGEPDGLDGLARRGPYERLTLSELALVDEYPDEFVRRAAMGEHLFTRLAERSPAASRASVALFDAGPNQLGAPRVAHVAALVALARRAAAARASFAWGVLQHVHMTLVWETTPSSVRRLLDLRSGEEATDAHVAAWRELLAAAPGPEDVWVVGGARLGRLDSARGLSRLEIVDPYEPGSRRLDVTARPRASAPREIRLELPPERACIRLLRDPIEAAVAPTAFATVHAPGTNLQFDASGLKLFARAANGSVVAYPVPNSPRAGVGRPKRVGPTDGVLAVGRAYRKIAVVSVDGDSLVLTTGGRDARLLPHGRYAWIDNAPRPAPVAALGSVYFLRGNEQAIVVDPSGAVLRARRANLNRTDPESHDLVGVVTIEGAGVLAATGRSAHVVFVGRTPDFDDDDRVRIVTLGQDVTRERIPFASTPDAAFFGFGRGIGRPEYGLLAIRFGGFRWRVLTRDGYQEISVSAGSRVVGVAGWPDKSGRFGLLTVGEDGRTIALEGRTERKDLVIASAPVVAFATSTVSPAIAFATERGEVVVWSFEHGGPLARFEPGATW